jgi:hypothetical protein
MHVSAIEVKRQRGRLVVVALGQTPRGQSFIKGIGVLNSREMTDESFKTDLAEAVKDILSREV